MQLTVSRGDFARLLADVSKVVEKRNTIPILSNIKLSASAEGSLRVTGTDLDIEISKSTGATVAEAGEITVNASRLHAVVAKLAAGEVSLTLDEHTLIIKAGRSRFTLPTLPASDFPEMNRGDGFSSFEIDINALLAPVKFSISTEETRYYLNGIFLHKIGESVRAVSTDGHKLGCHDSSPMEFGPKFAGVIIPRKTVEILSILKGAVQVSVSPQKIMFAADDTIVVSKLIEGTFPDYERVIPSNNPKLARLDRAEFASAVERASTVISEGGRALKITLAPGSAELSMNTQDGSSHEEIEADYHGEPIEIGVNPRYLLEVLGSGKGDTIDIALADPGSPILFTNPADSAWRAVCMPMRV
jgi:DNA polymerase-3 subunit beta